MPRRFLRPLRLAILALLLGALAAGLVFGPTIAAQARAVVVLSTTLETPVLTWSVRKLTKEPRVEDTRVAGTPATLARPGGDGPWPAFVFMNGATDLGRNHPDVQRLARGLARAGFLVVVPDLPGLTTGAITNGTVAAAVAVARRVADRPDANGRVAFLGVSVGTTVALLAAQDPGLADRVSLVSGIAGYMDLVETLRLATTGFYREEGRLVRYDVNPFLGLAAARSLAAALPPSPERDAVAEALAAVDSSDRDPLAVLRSFPTDGLDEDARAVVALGANRDPRRFDALYAALPEELRAEIARLSPITRAGRLRAPVELAGAPGDSYFPEAQLQALARAARDVRVTVTEAFSHVIPQPSLTDPGDLFRFDGWAVRSLRAARR